MRFPLRLSRFSAFLALLVLSGCNTAYRQAMSRAEDATNRGDFMTAAQAYRDACAAAPDDEKACSRVPVFARKATEQALESARPACEAGDLDRCLPPLLAARDLLPDHPEVLGMLEKASELHTERCAQWKAEGPLDLAVAGLACLQSRGHQFPLPSYQTHLTESANRLASRFAELAVTAQDQGSAGAATVLWSTAQCLAPGSGKHLTHTPETLQEDVYDTFDYSVWTHRWASGFRFTLQASTPGAAPAAQAGQLRFEDEEHVGFGPAQLQADPLEVPPDLAYANAFLQQLSPQVYEAVKRDVQARGSARRAQCNELPANWGIPWVQCWAEASLWEHGQEPQADELLRVLATRADAPTQSLCR